MSRLLEKLYFIILVVIFIILLATPYIVKQGISFLEEELIEAVFIFVMLVVGFFIIRLYRKEVRLRQEREHKLEKKLNDSFQYIGKLNVQLQEMYSSFSGIDKYPTSKKDFKEITSFLLDKILGIVNVEWVMFRIIDLKTKRTLKEGSKARGGAIVLKYELSNFDILEGNLSQEYKIVKADNKSWQVPQI